MAVTKATQYAAIKATLLNGLAAEANTRASSYCSTNDTRNSYNGANRSNNGTVQNTKDTSYNATKTCTSQR